MKKTRLRSTMAPVPYRLWPYGTWHPGFTWTSPAASGTLALPNHRLEETIVYDNENFTRSSYCSHEKKLWNLHGSEYLSRAGNSNIWNHPVQCDGLGGLLTWVAGASAPYCPWFGSFTEPEPEPVWYPSVDVESILQTAIREMMPKVKAETSLINFFVEVADVRRMAKYPTELMNFIMALKHFRGMPMKRILQEAANGHLQWSFGFAPFARDLMAFYGIYLNTATLFEDLWERRGVVQTRHYSPGEEHFSNSHSADYYPAGDTNWRMSLERDSSATRTTTVTMKYRFDRIIDAFGNPLDKDLAKLGHTLDQLELSWNPKIVWDAVPFSFVVDWFVTVGNWLESFEVNNLRPAVTILDACYSIKERRATKYTMRLRSKSDNYTATIGNGVGVATQINYDRRFFVPRATWLHGDAINFNTLSLREVALGTSLIVTNTR